MFKINKYCPSGSANQSFLNKTVLVVVLTFSSFASYAQCAMCRAALGGDSNTKKAAAVNDGIVYLMIIPYLLVVIIGYIIYRMYKAKKK